MGNVEKLLSSLNSTQREAVLHIDGALLILAGAGSGKTKTLTTRLAYLIDSVGIPPNSTLTLTFTNKAATQMRYRALNLIDYINSTPPLLCTFHKFGLLFLKLHIHHLERKTNFVLIDTEDRKKIIKNIDSTLPSGILLNEISKMKNAIIYPQNALQSANDKISKQIANTYALYNQYLLQHNMLDFDDLLLLSFEILDKDDSLCAEISRQYSYIMVDEYQDTNELQYKLLKKLCFTHNNICVVGDDDQSIYGWRGANINNILDFKDNFCDAKIIRLEQNYRSTSEILDAANALISHNERRLGKELQSVRGKGKQIEVIKSSDERSEAINIAKRIRKLVENGENLENIAILFRLNALSRSIEEGLNKENIPYKLIGAVRFYERAEIKDILSYFRLLVNINDDFSLLRIINRPKRGIGKGTQDKLERFATLHQISIHQAITYHANELGISSRQINAISGIFALLEELKEALNHSSIKFLELFKEKINILDTFENNQDDIDREANINEFYGYFREYIIQNPMASLEDFLNDISLSSDDSDIDGAVSCMSVHSAKGLEFEHLFVIGFESGFFPLMSENGDIEEERRLGYVAITRAKSELVISYVDSRFYKGKRTALYPSQFLKEAGLVAKKENHTSDENDKSFKKNDLVRHKIFGVGRVVSVIGEKQAMFLRINFGGMEKEIIASFVCKIEG